MQPISPVRRLLLLLPTLLCIALPVTGQELFSVIDADDTPRRGSAHSPVKLCFMSEVLAGDPVLFWTFSRNGKELAGIPGFAGGVMDGTNSWCFTAPAVEGAGEWKNCQEPQEEYTEVYDVIASVDTTGAPAGDPAHDHAGRKGQMRWTLIRDVTQFDEQPDDCLKGNWTWTFKAGNLTCQKLPFPVTLPGFSEPVVILNDGLQMKVTGQKTGDTLVMLRERNDVTHKGKKVPNFMGIRKDAKLFDGASGMSARYTTKVVSDDRMEGVLTVENQPYQGDVCSITWPYDVRRAN